MFGATFQSISSRVAPRTPGLAGGALAIASFLLQPYMVLAQQPSGPNVVAGTATFAANGNTLTVTNSPSAIIYWQSFNIGAGNTTRFIQQSTTSNVLNRVLDANPSVILGSLTSNGNVFLINPNGIIFGASARSDVGGLTAITLALSDANFLISDFRLGLSPGGSVVLAGAETANRLTHIIAIRPGSLPSISRTMPGVQPTTNLRSTIEGVPSYGHVNSIPVALQMSTPFFGKAAALVTLNLSKRDASF